MSHFFNARIEEKYNRLSKELNLKDYDVYLLLILNNKSDMEGMSSGINMCVYDAEDLNSLGYTPIFESILPGSCHFPVLRFYKDHPKYSFYWFIEYDVEFTASWSILTESYENDSTDYIVPFLAKYDVSKNRGWQWWSESNNSGFPVSESYRAFHPICRYSNKALECIDKYLKRGYSAHSEVLVPTLLDHMGMTMKKFSDDYFIREKDFSSFRYRPVFSPEEFKQRKSYCKLYHPVKI